MHIYAVLERTAVRDATLTHMLSSSAFFFHLALGGAYYYALIETVSRTPYEFLVSVRWEGIRVNSIS